MNCNIGWFNQFSVNYSTQKPGNIISAVKLMMLSCSSLRFCHLARPNNSQRIRSCGSHATNSSGKFSTHPTQSLEWPVHDHCLLTIYANNGESSTTIQQKGVENYLNTKILLVYVNYTYGIRTNRCGISFTTQQVLFFAKFLFGSQSEAYTYILRPYFKIEWKKDILLLRCH
jgi:hypothetical protein